MSQSRRAVSNWLFLLCFMVFGMVVGGGHARTIGAGFAIQVWRPFTGFIPPLTAAAWAHQFSLFAQTAQFRAQPISLEQYKALFWPMFLDRCWGRLLALVFMGPFLWFWRAGRLSNRLALWLLAIFAAGGAQAAFGWVMVETGLQPGVLSPPPLLAAPHFMGAMIIFGALLWTALSQRSPMPAPCGGFYLRPWLNLAIGLILLTMGFGALVAATNAISVFNNFPLMGGHWLPPGIFALHPAWLNFIANQGTVQFFHRLLATLTTLLVFILAVLGLREAGFSQGQRDVYLALAGLVALQYLLGMAALVLDAPELGFIHELNAVLLLAAAIAARHGLRGARSGRSVATPAAVLTGVEK